MTKTSHGGGRGRGRGKGQHNGRGGRGQGRGGDRDGKRGGKKREQRKATSLSTAPQQHHQRARRDPAQDRRPPLSFPGLRGPVDSFVDESHPDYEGVWRSCYDGFCVEGSDTFSTEVHDNARQAFDALEQGGVFRTDVTQPFGLGTKCAATYVTRTLAGEPGTTYKYLGLRLT